jgi:hypothetical protein
MQNSDVTNYIENAPESQREAMNVLRELIHSSIENVVEEYKWSRPVFKLNKDFAYFKTAKNYLTLGFFDFHKITDTHNLLEGTGKDMRHIKIKTTSDINSNLMKEWFKAVAE